MRIKTDKVKEAGTIPSGEYQTKVISCRVVDGNASIELRITEGKFKSRKIFYWIRGDFLARVLSVDKSGIRYNKVTGITSELSAKEARSKQDMSKTIEEADREGFEFVHGKSEGD